MTRRSKRTHKLVGVKLYHDTEGDILDWLAGVEPGHVSDILVMALRGYMTGEPVYPKPPELLQRLDEFLSQVSNGMVFGGISQQPATYPDDSGDRLSREEAERLAAVIKGSAW